MAATHELLKDKTTTGAGVGYKLNTPFATFQATVSGTGAVTATVLVQGSNDGTNFFTIATIPLSGTTSATDGAAIQAPYAWVRGNLSAVSGTGAAVTLTMGV